LDASDQSVHTRGTILHSMMGFVIWQRVVCALHRAG
jgi:hypothetical protein